DHVPVPAAHDARQEPDRRGARVRGVRARAVRPGRLLPRAVLVSPAPAQEGDRTVIDVRMSTVGPVQENCFIVRQEGAEHGVIVTPGHSPGHVTYAVRGENALFSGDVLFQGSVGRVDLPGGDWPTLLASIETLVDSYADETTVYPGHMGITTLGAERATNPFLRELATQQ